jgi:hypothetical protein
VQSKGIFGLPIKIYVRSDEMNVASTLIQSERVL